MHYGNTILSGWESDLLTGMRSITAGVIGGGSALNRTMVDNLHRRYIVLIMGGALLPRYDTGSGNAAAGVMLRKLADETGYSVALVRAFLVTLYDLQKAGKIPEAKYDPSGAKSRSAARAKADPSIWDQAGKAAGAVTSMYGKIGIGLALVAALGAAVYFKIGRK